MTDDARLATLLGRELDPLRFPIESGKIAEFARSLKNDDPRFFDTFSDSVPAPLTFSVVSRLYGSGDALQLVKDLGLADGRVVHGTQEWIYHRPMVSGQVLEGTPTVTEAYTKKNRAGGTMTFVMVETVFRDLSDDQPVVTERMLSIELPESETRK